MPFYAQLDDQATCFAISELSGIEAAPSLVPIDTFDTSVVGRRWTGSAWADPPAPPFETRRQNALDALAAHRYTVETGGTTFGGWPTHTGRETQAMVNACYNMAVAGYWQGGWKFADGIYRTLTAERVIGLALTIGAHVQASFAREAEIATTLRAATDDAGLEWEW